MSRLLLRLSFAGLAAAWLAGCAGKCVMPTGSTCSADSDCVLAVCADEACSGCSGGSAIAKSQLGQSSCLVAVGTTAPLFCSQGPTGCECPCFSPATAVCVSGTCMRQVADGGCGA